MAPATTPSTSWSNTTVMAMAALVAAAIAMFGEKAGLGALSIAASLITLVPWALMAGGIRLPTAVVLLGTLAPAGLIIVVDKNPGGMFPAMVTMLWVTREYGRSWITYAAGAATIGFTVGHAIRISSTHESGMVYFAGGVLVSVFCGSMLRRQDRLVHQLEEAQELRSLHAASNERTRIAREVHDVIAHSLTVVMLNVTGARRAIVSDPEGANRALERAETVGRESLASVRQIVGLLRSDDSQVDDGPLPTLDDLPALISQYRDAGLAIDADLRLDDVDTEPGAALVAFRVVQEALSNVLQHAPGHGCTVDVGRQPGANVLRLVIENSCGDRRVDDGRRGLGVLGMHERAKAVGGSVEAGITDRHTWRVEAVLPFRRIAATLA